ncbi:MAG: hypothetical protein MJ233_02655 [Mycoplasmoidaceae bacterium]|nr:hypothetical protein [Mycoplasmoidaceae bacterium]
MKKIKLITTFSILGTISGIVAPMTSCAPTIDTYTISLYSDTGSFEHNNKLISIGNIEKGSSLGSLKGYAEPTMQGKRFVC